MSGAPLTERRLLTPRKVLVQLLGFAVGAALLGWCIAIAARGEGWSHLRTAPPPLVLGLVGCTLVSLGVNGTMFWLAIRPVRHEGFWDMQRLNLVTSVLNYAPVRLGFVARVAYHLRVDGMSLVVIGAWLASLAFILGLTLGACVVATIVRPVFDVLWLALVLGQLVVAGVVVQAIMGQPIASRVGRGLETMLRRPDCLWGGMGLRLVDIAAFVGRMACAALILDLGLPAADVLLLGFAALFMSLNPLGRVGYREVTVAFVASRLVGGDLSGHDLETRMATLALVESAGEALVSIPLGSLSLLWYRRCWRTGRQKGDAPPPPPPVS